MNKLARTLVVAALVAANTLAAFAAQPASAAAVQSGSLLEIALGPGSFDVTIETGPAAGHVRLSGVPGIPDGTLYTGVDTVRYSSGAGGDTVQVKQTGTVLPAVYVSKGAGNLFVEANIDVIATNIPVVSTLNVASITGNSQAKLLLQSDAQDLTLNWRTAFGAGIHEVEQTILADDPSQRLAGSVVVALGTGASKNNTTIKSAAQAIDLDLNLNAGSSGELNLVTDHIAAGTANARVTLSGSQKVNWKWGGQTTMLALNGAVNGSAMNEEFSVELDARQTSGTLSIPARNGNDKIAVLVKGASTLTGVINGNEADDEVKVFVEGSNAGRLVLNGGPGQDTCDASPGVVVQNCE
jgi:hypothetical protein